MTEFIPFNSLEEAQAMMQRAEAAANAKLQEGQIALRDDTAHERYWMHLTPYGFIEYGHCWSEKLLREKTEAAYANDPGENYAEEEIASSLEARKRGYLFGTAHATFNVKGDLGSTHVSQVIPISEDMFNCAREAGWNLQ